MPAVRAGGGGRSSAPGDRALGAIAVLEVHLRAGGRLRRRTGAACAASLAPARRRFEVLRHAGRRARRSRARRRPPRSRCRSISSSRGVASSEARARASASRNNARNPASPPRRAAWPRRGESADDREDRAFTGIGERLARIGRSRRQRVGELHGRQRGPGRRAVADAVQELREDRARVAARAVERGVRDARQQLAGVRLGPGAQRSQHRLQREREIRARVAVRHGKHVDLVDHFLAGDQAVDAGAQRPGEFDAAERLARLGGVVHGRRG